MDVAGSSAAALSDLRAVQGPGRKLKIRPSPVARRRTRATEPACVTPPPEHGPPTCHAQGMTPRSLQPVARRRLAAIRWDDAQYAVP